MAATNRMTEAQQMAQSLGVVVGAASCCEQVTADRINTVSAKLRQLVSASADDAADADAANQQFSVALEAGKTGVEMGRIDPERAEAALIEIEEQLYA